ncbi:MAG: hypothetical protein GX287_00270 [Fusobacteria bacterium]|nr:hypothetical protein [Fusobacteriota bacterium]
MKIKMRYITLSVAKAPALPEVEPLKTKIKFKNHYKMPLLLGEVPNGRRGLFNSIQNKVILDFLEKKVYKYIVL